MRVCRTSALTGLAMLLCAPAWAAPAALLNKSITVSYTTTIPGKKLDGSPVQGSRVATRTVYISSAGRILRVSFAATARTPRPARPVPANPATPSISSVTNWLA